MSQVAEVSTPPRDGDGDAPFDGLRLRRLTKEFANFTAVKTLDLDVPSGSFFALLGPSGCGKTTTLRMVAGLETPTSGTIQLGDRDITWDKPYKRPVNTVFQNYALFPHLDIFENVAFGLRRRKDKGVDEQVRQMLDLVELDSQARKKPAQLSGGQQQRVALARALINRPEVLLLDEPLGALDLKLRRSMQIELKRIQTEVGLTFVHVTHDQEEAMTMADTIAVMNAGVIEQMGAPGELYDNPQTTFVANFLGQSNLIEGRIKGREGDFVVVDMKGVLASIPAERAHVSGTAERARLGRDPPGEGAHRRRGRGHRRPRQQHPRRRGQRRQLRRRQHAVPRPDAVGPGDPGLRAEHRPPPALPPGRAGRPLLATRVRVPPRPQPGRRRGRRPRGRRAVTAATVGGARVAASEPDEPEERHVERRKLTGYWLLLPGTLWLVVFFVVPLYSLVATSLYNPTGSVLQGYEMDWSFSNYSDALQAYWRPLVRSLLYGAVATLICLVLGYVLAYAIAFKSGRWKNLMLILVIAPFFTSFLVRTLSWKLLLRDDGFIVNTLQFLHLMSADGRLLATPVAVIAGLVYNFLPFMVLPALREHRQDRPPPDRGRRRPLLPSDRGVLQGDLAAVPARRRLRHAADLHPGRR